MDNQQQIKFEDIKIKIKKYIYAIMVFLISLTMMIVAPMFNSNTGELTLELPTSKRGWLVFLSTRAILSGLNTMIFVCFAKQGDLNTVNHPNRLKADEILGKCDIKVDKPLSPTQYQIKQYGTKGVTVCLSTFAALVALPELVEYDWRQALTYFLTIVIAVVFGIMTMMNNEAYWSVEYLKYAQYVEREIKEAKTSQNGDVENIPIVSSSESNDNSVANICDKECITPNKDSQDKQNTI